MAVLRNETFGPVAPVVTLDSFADALARASDSTYCLAATVLTPSMSHAQRAWRELPVGTVKVNAAAVAVLRDACVAAALAHVPVALTGVQAHVAPVIAALDLPLTQH
jgi:acyl-CoA reductase-like NAD-dependent aldehyde dehydrogenase